MISVVVPAYNEEELLRETVKNVVQSADAAGSVTIEIIIVNDGSRDRTGPIIAELEKAYPCVRGIHHAENSGLGVCIKDALAQAKYAKFMIVPGDNDMSPDLITNLFRNYDKADLILAYFINKEDRGRLRNVISTLYGLVYMCVFNVFIQYINSPCIYPTEKIRGFHIRSKRFSVVAELTIKCLRSGCTFHEISGYMQTGVEGSSSLGLKSFLDVVSTFLKLVKEIKLSHNLDFNKKPVRINPAA
ncbi:MAG: glycosyltransferase family 2 protein, partial [Candidatus Omnitrophota bacterium]